MRDDIERLKKVYPRALNVLDMWCEHYLTDCEILDDDREAMNEFHAVLKNLTAENN